MAGVARGIGGFLNGIVAGGELRHRWDDRKRDQQYEDEDRVLDREDRARRIRLEDERLRIETEDRARRQRLEDEQNGWAREDRAYQTDARKREEEDRKVFADAYNDAKAAEAGAGTAPETPAETPTPAMPEPSAPAQLPSPAPEKKRKARGIPGAKARPTTETAAVTGAPAAAEAVDRPYQPTSSQPAPAITAPAGAEVPQAPAPEPAPEPEKAPAAGSDAWFDRFKAAAPEGERSAYAADPAALAGMDPMAAAQRLSVPAGPTSAPQAAPAPQPPAPAPRGRNAIDPAQLAAMDPMAAAQAVSAAPQRSGGTPPVVSAQAPAMPAAPAVSGAVAPAALAGMDPMQAAQAVSTPRGAVGVPGVPAPAPAVARPAIAGLGAAPAPDAPPPAQPAARLPRRAMPDPAIPADPAVANHAAAVAAAVPAAPPPKAMVPSDVPADPENPPTTPSIEGAVAIARGTIPGSGGKAAEGPRDFIKWYGKVAAPKIIDHYLSRGEVEKAEKFETWVQAATTKAGLRAWSKGVIAAQQGNEDGFVAAMIEAYNADGYTDDGMTALADGSGLTRDKAGNVIGGRVTLRNDATGEVFVQNFNEIEDIYRFGINFLSPEQVFENTQEQLKAAATAETEIRKHERALELAEARRATKDAKTPAERVRAQVALMAQTDFSFSSLPPEEQVAKAIAQLEAIEAGAATLGQPKALAAPVE